MIRDCIEFWINYIQYGNGKCIKHSDKPEEESENNLRNIENF
jgi:hypothetical protein